GVVPGVPQRLALRHLLDQVLVLALGEVGDLGRQRGRAERLEKAALPGDAGPTRLADLDLGGGARLGDGDVAEAGQELVLLVDRAARGRRGGGRREGLADDDDQHGRPAAVAVVGAVEALDAAALGGAGADGKAVLQPGGRRGGGGDRGGLGGGGNGALGGGQ